MVGSQRRAAGDRAQFWRLGRRPPVVINAYLLPLSALLLIGGAAGDRFGRRRLLVSGLRSSRWLRSACAAAPNIAMLLAARAVQGIGAAMLMPNSLAILGSAFSGEERAARSASGRPSEPCGRRRAGARRLAYRRRGWRAVFLVNAPLGAAAISDRLTLCALKAPRGVQPLDLGRRGAGDAGARIV